MQAEFSHALIAWEKFKWALQSIYRIELTYSQVHTCLSSYEIKSKFCGGQPVCRIEVHVVDGVPLSALCIRREVSKNRDAYGEALRWFRMDKHCRISMPLCRSDPTVC